MAGEPNESAPVTVAGVTPEPAAASPVVVAPAASPDPDPVAAPEPVAAPIQEPVAPAAPVSEPTLLQKFDAENAEKPAAVVADPGKPAEKPVEAKPAEPAKPVAEPVTPPVEAAKPADGAIPPAPASAEPVAYEYALPETIKLDDATKGSFHTALDAFRADPAKGAQGLIDLHNTTMQQYADGLANEQVRVWNDTRRGWVTDVMADEELGGAGYQTTMGSIARMRDLLVPESRREAFESMLQTTGVGDHPEFLRLLHNAARIYDEAPMPPPGPRPPADIGKPPGAGRLRNMYKSNQGRQ